MKVNRSRYLKHVPLQTQPIVTRIIGVVDRSGSMGHLTNATIAGFNEFLHSQQAEEPDARMSLILFGTTRDVIFRDEKVSNVRDLDDLTYRAYEGSTNLYDAVMEAIQLGDPRASSSNTRVVFLIITDGLHNDTRRNTRDMVAQEIQALQNRGDWTFVYMGANQDAWAVGKDLGIHRGNTMTYAATEVGTQNLYRQTSTSTSELRTSGALSTKSFFTPDLSALKPTQIRKNLIDIQGQVKTAPVPRECQISDFCEQQFGSYTPGRAYYQLSKPELVQQGKGVMIMEKGKKSVYAGHQVRQVLGMPLHGDVKVTPGNHANYDIFVQSTSMNRKLVRGTKLLYSQF